MTSRQQIAMVGVAAMIVVFSGAGYAPSPAPQLTNPHLVTDFSQGLEVYRALNRALPRETAQTGHTGNEQLFRDVSRFYATTGYALAWFGGEYGEGRGSGEILRPGRRASELIGALTGAARLGLNPEDYQAVELSAIAARWNRPGARNFGVQERAEFDVALSIAGLHFARDLRFGRANPGTFDVGLTRRSGIELPSLFRTSVVNGPDFARGLAELQPPYAEYRRLVDALQHYRDLAQRYADLPLPPATKEVVQVGSNYDGIAELTNFLFASGDLQAGDLLPGLESAGENIFTPGLAAGVKRFQARHGLAADGQIGPATIAAMRVPFAARAHQLELNLERWRWLPHDFAHAPVMVNIPEFRLRAMQDKTLDKPAWETNVIVGQARGHRTPSFGDEMEYLVFSPYWNVTPNITRNELVPHLVKDPGYLKANRYEITTWQGEVITDDLVADAALLPELLPKLRAGSLAIRQKPGAGNSLGGVKFIFPNENDIYLHDTPSKNLFAATRRDFSHGCIRVEHPEELAAWVLATNQKPDSNPGRGRDADWTPATIDREMHRTTEKIASLSEKIPVLLVYHTASVTAAGETRFFTDIYGRDQELTTQLAANF